MKNTIPKYITDAANRVGTITNEDLALIARVLPRENDLALWTLEVYGEGQVLARIQTGHKVQAQAFIDKLPAWRRAKLGGVYTAGGVACTGVGFRIQRPKPKAPKPAPAVKPKAGGPTPTYFEVHFGGPAGLVSVPKYDDPNKAKA